MDYKNRPLTSQQVKALPLGYNITGVFPNKFQRRAMIYKSVSSVPKKNTIQNVLGGFDANGNQIIPMWKKKVPYINSKGQETGYWRLAKEDEKTEAFDKEGNGLAFESNMRWELDPRVVLTLVVKRIIHENQN